jgi:all-trans-nonaprenyl-diphosphate synthase
MTSVTSLFAPVEDDLAQLVENLKQLIGARHPVLFAAAEHLFKSGGKRVRPAIVLLLARAVADAGAEISPRHRRLAEITEMIHNASLFHDDVVDEAEMRRGVTTVNYEFGNRIAIQAGDFLFAQASWYLANLDNLEVVKLLSEVIKDLAEGEIQQGFSSFDVALTLENYLEKSYYKTASLIANSSKAVGVLSEAPADLTQDFYEFGRAVGLAFQIVDDILDFTSTVDALGKPACADLKSGNLTAPVLFAMEEKPYLQVLIERELTEPGDLEEAIALINHSQGIARSRALAEEYAASAVQRLAKLPASDAKQALIELTDYILKRLY